MITKNDYDRVLRGPDGVPYAYIPVRGGKAYPPRPIKRGR
jgi:hypothetical protein